MTPTETHDETLAADQPATDLATTDHGHDHAGHDHQHAPTLNPELTRSIEVDAPAADVDKAFSKVTKRYAKLARIPGFRAGKVPESLIKSRFAKEVRQEVLESLIADRFRKTLGGSEDQPHFAASGHGYAVVRRAATALQGYV